MQKEVSGTSTVDRIPTLAKTFCQDCESYMSSLTPSDTVRYWAPVNTFTNGRSLRLTMPSIPMYLPFRNSTRLISSMHPQVFGGGEARLIQILAQKFRCERGASCSHSRCNRRERSRRPFLVSYLPVSHVAYCPSRPMKLRSGISLLMT